MAFAANCIDHVEVYVRDIEAATAWYGRVLGLRECGRWHPEPVMIGAGGTMLALFQARANGAPPPADRTPGSWHRVAWRTDQFGFEAARKHLAALGIPFRGPVDHQRAWSLYFSDPDGNPLEITYYVAADVRPRA